MTEPFAADLDQHARHQHARHQQAVTSQREIAAAWDGLVAAVGKWEVAHPSDDDEEMYTRAAAIIHAARIYVKARQGGNE